MKTELVVILLCLPLFCSGQASDKTLQPHARGEDVVDAVIIKIRSKCILVDDKSMMRRIAAVDTDFGQNSSPNTGGIWKVSKPILSTVRSVCSNRLRSVCNTILRTFYYDATRAVMPQMDTPLYSGLVMHIYLSYLTTIRMKIPVSKSGQAAMWKRVIRPIGKLQAKDFIAKLPPKNTCSAVKMDLVFVIDASGSVGSTNFRKTLTFLRNVVSDLQIASDLTRVAVIRFASTSSILFNLDAYNTKSDIDKAIARIRYTGGGTATDRAIDFARTNVFQKARQNVPKVFVLVTDGYSNSRSRTIIAANKIKKEGVTIFPIGIGNVNQYEMLSVASSPSCTHYFSLSSYSEIDAIIQEIQRESCEAPVALDLTSGKVPDPVIDGNPLPSDNTTKIQNIDIVPSNNKSDPQNMTTIKVDVSCGTVNIYAHHLQTPSASIYDYSAIATDGSPGWIRSQTKRRLYLSLRSQKRLDLTITECSKPHYNISINPVDTEVTVICREGGKERKCTTDDIKSSFGPLCGDDNVPNPCTKANILKNIMRFKHPKSLTKYIQCKLSGKMEIVNCPKGTQYDESQSVCDPQITSVPQTSVAYTGANPCTRQAIMNKQFYFANPSDKSKFIQCNEWGGAFLVNCPKNMVWSQQAYTCVNNSRAVSPTINPCKSPKRNPSLYYANPTSRKSFIQCDASGNAYTLQCPLGTVWLQAKLTCVHDSIKLGLSMTPHLKPPKSTALKTPVPKVPVPKAPKCTFGEYLPHKNPQKYNICQFDGSLTEMSCPGTLVWSQSNKVCTWPSGSG